MNETVDVTRGYETIHHNVSLRTEWETRRKIRTVGKLDVNFNSNDDAADDREEN